MIQATEERKEEDREPSSPGGGALGHSRPTKPGSSGERRETRERGELRSCLAARGRERVVEDGCLCGNPNGSSGVLFPALGRPPTRCREPTQRQPKCNAACIAWLRPIPPFPAMHPDGPLLHNPSLANRPMQPSKQHWAALRKPG